MRVEHPLFYKTLTIGSQCPCIRNIGHIQHPKEVTETGPIFCLILGLLVTESVKTLKKHHPEHQRRVYRRTSGIPLPFFGENSCFKNRAEHLEIHKRGHDFEWIPKFLKAFHGRLVFKKSVVLLILAVLTGFFHGLLRFRCKYSNYFANIQDFNL